MRQKKTVFKVIGYVIFALSLFVLGFYIGIANYTHFKLSETISIVINPSIIITIILAYYVTRILTKQNEQDNQEKILLIEYFKNFQQQLDNKCSEIFNSEGLDPTLSSVHLKFLRQKLYLCLALAEEQNFINKDEIKNNLSEELTKIWEILTDENHYDEKGLQSEYKSKTNTCIVKIEKLIFKIIIKINSH